MLVAGGVTIIIGALFILIVPPTPASAWFLTPKERLVAVKRVEREHVSAQHSDWRWDQAYETLKDPLVREGRLAEVSWVPC